MVRRCHPSFVADREEHVNILNRPPELATQFDRVADDYEARPGYPDWVFERLVERCGLDPGAGPRAYGLDLAARMAEIDRVGSFGPMEHEVLLWEGKHDPPALRRMFATFAAWIALPEPIQTELLDEVERLARDEFGGMV